VYLEFLGMDQENPAFPQISVVPVRKNGQNSNIVLTCDASSRKIRAFSTINNQLLQEFRFKKSSLSQNYPKLCCQLGPKTFLFVETQIFGSDFAEIQAREISAVVRDFGTVEHMPHDDDTLVQQESLSVRNCEIIANNFGYLILWPKWENFPRNASHPLWVLKILPNLDENQNIDPKRRFKFDRSTIDLPDEISDQEKTFVILPGCGNTPKLLIFHVDPAKDELKSVIEKSIDKIDKDFEITELQADPNFGYPSGKIIDNRLQPFVTVDKVYFLEIDKKDKKTNLWILKSCDEIFQWEKIPLKNIRNQNQDTIQNFFIVDNQCFVVNQQNDPQDGVYIENVGFIDRPSTLQGLAREKVQEIYSNTFDEQVFGKKSIDWLDQKFKKPNNFDEETMKITIVRLRAEIFQKFCHQILKIPENHEILKHASISSRENGRFEVKFNDNATKTNFLDFCRREAENLNLFAANTVEIYSNEAWYENLAPIVVSLPSDFAVLRPML